MADELRYKPRAAGRLARLLGFGTAGRAGMAAFVAGSAGAVAFVASLVIDWQHVTIGRSDFFSVEPGSQFTVGLDAAGYANGYLVGVLGLLAMLGLVLARPELARQLRVTAAALGVGLVGVLVAITDQLQDVMARFYGFSVGFPTNRPPEIQQIIDTTTYAPRPGLFLAFAAVILPVVGTWLAAGRGRPAEAFATVSAGEAAEAPVSPAVPVADPATVPHSPTAPVDPGIRVGFVDGLTVTSSDVIDPGTQPDILRN